MPLSSRHCRTLCAIFEHPTRSDVRWSDFEALYRALGGKKPQTGRTSGSRRRLLLNGRRAVFHAPHPQPEMTKTSIESARDFLLAAGVTPNKEQCQC